MEDVREYSRPLEDGDPAPIAAALGDVARARGMTEIAREAGISREAMYKAFRPEGNPTLETLARVIGRSASSLLSARLKPRQAGFGIHRSSPRSRPLDGGGLGWG